MIQTHTRLTEQLLERLLDLHLARITLLAMHGRKSYAMGSIYSVLDNLIRIQLYEFESDNYQQLYNYHKHIINN